MRVINLTVNGLYDAVDRGLFEWLSGKDADIIALQNICCREYKIEDDPRFDLAGFERYLFEGEDEDYGGTALYVKKTPKAVMRGVSNYDIDRHGTLIQADYDQISVASLWLPSGMAAETIKTRALFRESLKVLMSKVRRKRRLFIYAGNFQLAHQTIDLSHPERHSNTQGHTPDEIQWMSQMLENLGYRDALRQVDRNGRYFSWWPDMHALNMAEDPGAWRVDYQITSESLGPKVLTASYYTEKRFSDHAPLIVDYDVEL